MANTGKTLRLIYPDRQYGENPGSGLVPRLLSEMTPGTGGAETVEVPCDDLAPVDVPFGVSIREAEFLNLDHFIKIHSNALKLLDEKNPAKIVYFATGATSSLAPVDYLSGEYDDFGVLWLDVHTESVTPIRFWHKRIALFSACVGSSNIPKAENLLRRHISPDRLFFASAKIDEMGGGDKIDFGDLAIRTAGLDALEDGSVLSWIREQGIGHLLIHVDMDSIGAAEVRSGQFREDPLAEDPRGGKVGKTVKAFFEKVSSQVSVVGLGVMDYDLSDLSRFEEAVSILKL